MAKAKDHAIVTVDELLYFADTQANGTQKGESARVDWVDYFGKVREELNK